jgi:transposase
MRGREDRIRALTKAGMRVRDIAQSEGITMGYVHNIMRRARDRRSLDYSEKPPLLSPLDLWSLRHAASTDHLDATLAVISNERVHDKCHTTGIQSP